MNKGSILVDLRPNRLLLDPSFGGYKLSLDSIPIYRTPIESGVKVVQPGDDQFSFYHVKIFSLHNHLHVNHFKPDSVYFTDKYGKVFKATSSPPDHMLITKEVYQIPNTQQHPGNYNTSIIFPTSDTAVISDGSGGIYFAEVSQLSGQEVWTGEKYELFKEEANCLLADVRIDDEQVFHILLLHVEEKEEKDAKAGLFQTKLKWRTFTRESNTWKKKYLRELSIDGSVDYVALEPGCKSLYVISDKSPKWVYDSINSVKEVEEKPKQPKLYTWTQTQDEVTIWVPLSENLTKTDTEISVTDLHIDVKIKGITFLSGDLFHRVNKDLTVWNYEKDRLEIQLTKNENALMWKTLIPGDKTGEEILDPEVVKNIHEKLAHLCSDKEETGTTPSFNTQQLEECDAVSCDTTTLVRINGETHTITHEVSLSSLQWLFKVFCDPTETPAICIRHDVDACVWQFKRGDDEKTWPHEHVGTFSAFGYVQASKTQKKFTASPPNLSYVVLCEASHHIYIYRQPSPLASELKNRKTGKKVDTISKQQLVNLEANQQILGVHATNNLLYVLLENSICALNINE